MLTKLSSSFEKPNINRGDAMFQLLKITDNGDLSLKIQRLSALFYDLCDNQTKDSIISYCLSERVDGNFLNKFSDKLRATNSKRHLKEKLMFSYLDTKTK